MSNESRFSKREWLILILVFVAIAGVLAVGYFVGVEWAGGLAVAGLASTKILKDKEARDRDSVLVKKAKDEVQEAQVAVVAAIKTAEKDMNQAKKDIPKLTDEEKKNLAKILYKKQRRQS